MRPEVKIRSLDSHEVTVGQDIYVRYEPDNWELQMGESMESVLPKTCLWLEELYQNALGEPEDELEPYIPKPPKYYIKKYPPLYETRGDFFVVDETNRLAASKIKKDFAEYLKMFGIVEEG